MRDLQGVCSALLAFIVLEAVLTPNLNAAPVGTAFTYQGLLSDGGRLATGVFDLRFALYDAATGGAPRYAVTNENIRVTDGLFTTAIDFGKNVNIFDGTEYWMEIAVRNGVSTGAFTALASRQLITPTPNALYANQAGAVSAGAIDGAALKDGAAVRSVNGLTDNFNIVGGPGVTVSTSGDSIIVDFAPTPVSCLTYSNCYWNLLGNGNITAGVNFLGTVAGELAPLEFRVNNNRSLLHDFTGANTSPNIMGGYRNNTVSGIGATISGGGQQTGINQVQSSWGTVGGGYSNVVQASSVGGTIPGGSSNRVAGTYGTVGGGAFNIVSNYSVISGGSLNRVIADDSSIGGGEGNVITTYASGMMPVASVYSAIGGGVSNVMTGTEVGTIGGGHENRLTGSGGRQVHYGTIGGGRGNSILSDSFSSHHSTIGGGLSNIIHTAGQATIGGGEGNQMFLEGHYATIGGGKGNRLDASYATISGGHSNTIYGPGNPDYATIGGGRENAILSDSQYSTISGGERNHIEGFAFRSTIGGGQTNAIIAANLATIGGGGTNLIADGADYATIAGGRLNTVAANSPYAAIGGGYSNNVTGDFATAPGGLRNRAQGNYSLAAGRNANAAHNGSFVWADDTDADFSSTSTRQFAVRAQNGVMIQGSTRVLDLRGDGAVRVAGAGIGSSGPAFIHRALAPNITGNYTTIDHPHCNNDPNAILMVTQNWNPGGGAGVYNNRAIGVWYDNIAARWAIFNQDLAAMPVNAAFNVVVIKN
jgi:hypothetical protein